VNGAPPPEDSFKPSHPVVSERLHDENSRRLLETESEPIARRVICDYCQEVIGIYEPAVVVRNEDIRETSRAAEPTIGAEPAGLYHRACYLERFGPLQA
jgi:hypothetical protein